MRTKPIVVFLAALAGAACCSWVAAQQWQHIPQWARIDPCWVTSTGMALRANDPCRYARGWHCQECVIASCGGDRLSYLLQLWCLRPSAFDPAYPNKRIMQVE